MHHIYKYPITPKGANVQVSENARVLTAQIQNGMPVLWILTNPRAKQVERFFEVFATSEGIEETRNLNYINTFQLETRLVFHVFERGTPQI